MSKTLSDAEVRKRLRDYQKESGLSLRGIAGEMGVTASTLCRVLAKERRPGTAVRYGLVKAGLAWLDEVQA